MKAREVDYWLDRNGWIHLIKDPALNQSENKVMYTGILSCFISVLPKFSEVWKVRHTFRRNEFREWGSPWSHDEMTGLYCLYKNKTGVIPRKLPIFKFNERLWLHPKDFLFYFYAKHPVLGFPFLWIPCLSMILTCFQTYKTRNGRKIIKTDGKLLAFMRCKSFNLKITFKICTWLIKRNQIFESWSNVAKIYFKEPGHPIPALMTEYEKELKSKTTSFFSSSTTSEGVQNRVLL